MHVADHGSGSDDKPELCPLHGFRVQNAHNGARAGDDHEDGLQQRDEELREVLEFAEAVGVFARMRLVGEAQHQPAGGQRREVEEGGQEIREDRRRIGEQRGEDIEGKQAGREDHGLKRQILARRTRHRRSPLPVRPVGRMRPCSGGASSHLVPPARPASPTRMEKIRSACGHGEPHAQGPRRQL